MSSRILISLAVAAALAAPIVAQADSYPGQPKGDWLFRVGVSQINPESKNLSASDSGLPANLVPDPGLNSGFKGMQLSVTSLACAVRQMAGPSSIHSLPTEQYNQDIVSLGTHAALTAILEEPSLYDEYLLRYPPHGGDFLRLDRQY